MNGVINHRDNRDRRPPQDRHAVLDGRRHRRRRGRRRGVDHRRDRVVMVTRGVGGGCCLGIAGIAGIAGAVAVGQLGEARRLRVEQAQPYVVAFMEPSGAGRFFVDLVVRNFGTTAAHDVRLTIDPAPCRRRGPWQPVWLPESIPVLVPGQEWRTFWDSGRRWELDLPDRHEAVVAFKDSQGKELAPLRSVLDWSAHKDQTNLEVFGAHHAANALRDINKTIAKWHESGYAGLAVTAWDGDAATERRRQRLEADETESDQTPEGSA
jgi:hypothetical protein